MQKLAMIFIVLSKIPSNSTCFPYPDMRFFQSESKRQLIQHKLISVSLEFCPGNENAEVLKIKGQQG